MQHSRYFPVATASIIVLNALIFALGMFFSCLQVLNYLGFEIKMWTYTRHLASVMDAEFYY
jgi:hypothetical protein